MAASAGKRETRFAELVRLLEPSPGRLELAIRLALICAATTLVTEIYQTPSPALAAYVVFFMNRADRMTSLVLNAALILVITVTIAILFLVAITALDDPMWRVASMALISFGLLFLVSASKLAAIGSTIALIVAYGLDLLGNAPVGEAATRVLLYTWLFIAIPAGVSIVVNLLIATAPRRLAERAIARSLELAAAMLAAPDERARAEFRDCLREGAGEIPAWLRMAGVEKTSPPADLAALRQAAESTVVVLSAIDLMDRAPEARLPDGDRGSLARVLREMSSILSGGGYPIDVTWDVTSEAELSPLASQVRADIGEALLRFAEAPRAAEPAPAKAEHEGGFFAADAFTNPDHVRFALKTTAAAMFCYALYSLLDWPKIHTALITCYIVSLGTAAESVEKLTLRVLGAIVGAAAGTATMIFLVPSLTSIGSLMAIVFLGCLASGYVAAGSPRIAYAGFQMAFAFLLCVVQGAGPSFDMATARDRVIGILIGNLVSYVVLTNLWPVSVGGRIDRTIATLMEKLSAMLRALTAPSRRMLASEAQAALSRVEADLAVIGYEPDSIRPSGDWVAARRLAAEEIGALEAPLLLAANRGGAGAGVARRLERLAATLGGHEPMPPDEIPAHRSDGLLHEIIDKHLQRLEAALSTVAIVFCLLLVGCATRGLELAPDRPDRPWLPETNADGEIVPGRAAPTSSTGDVGYVLPANRSLATVPSVPSSLDREHVYTLPELIDVAERNNPQTRIAWDEARNVALAAGIAESTFLPSLTANVVGGYQKTNASNSALGVSSSTDSSVKGTISTLSLQWLLFDFGERSAVVDAAKQASVVSNIAFTAMHQKVIYEVTLAYYANAAARARVDSASQALKDAEEVQCSSEQRYDHGVGTIVEVAQARQVTAQAKLAKVHADAAAEDTYLSLISAMGIVPLAKIQIAPVSRRELGGDLVRPVDDVVSAALSRRPDVLGADAARKASLASLRAAQAEFFPKLFLSTTGTYAEGDLNVTALPAIGEGLSTVNVTGHRFGTTVLLGVNVPLFDGGLRMARLEQARSKIDHAEAKLADVRNLAIREVVKAGNAAKTSLAAYEASEALAAAAQTTFDAAHGAYRNGVGSITAVTIAETQLLQAKDAATDAYSAALSAAATLALSAGTLGAAPR